MISTALAILMLFLVGNLAHASPYVTAQYTPLASGSYRLDFRVYLDQGYGDCYEWGLHTMGVTDLVAPSGWQAGGDLRRTGWSTPIASPYVLHPGCVLRGSSGTFAILPAQLDYYVLTTLGYGAHYGTVVPVPIPEPSSLLALCAGIGAMGALIRWRKA